MKRSSWVRYIALFILVVFSAAAHAEDFVLTLKNNQFIPRILTIPANQRVRITVKNQDVTPAEFESTDLDREKVVGANSEVIIFVGPVDAGTYGYFDDFHRNTTTGTIVAK
jgi:Cupredoxin-like domain